MQDWNLQTKPRPSAAAAFYIKNQKHVGKLLRNSIGFEFYGFRRGGGFVARCALQSWLRRRRMSIAIVASSPDEHRNRRLVARLALQSWPRRRMSIAIAASSPDALCNRGLVAGRARFRNELAIAKAAEAHSGGSGGDGYRNNIFYFLKFKLQSC